MKRKVSLPLLAVLFLPFVAQAHPGHGEHGLMSGLSHPLFGPDHLLAMVCVGVLATRTGGRAVWTIPATFVGVMLLGGILGMSGVALFSVEAMIAVSVIGLGLMLAMGKRPHSWLAHAAAAFFALFHGHAHGSEMPAIVQPALYAAGFVFMTATLHAGGIALGLSARRHALGPVLQRVGGLAVTGAGCVFLLG